MEDLMTTGFEEKFIIDLTQAVLDSIANGDYSTYDVLCADDMTCIEPESKGMVVKGKDFHRYYFDLGSSSQTNLDTRNATPKQADTPPTKITMVQPHVRLMANNKVAMISYIRLNQTGTTTTQLSETRVWECRDGKWKHVHFHKS